MSSTQISTDQTTETAATRPSADELQGQLEGHRRELTAYCYRMLGSGFESEDAVQETMVRAWRNLDSFEGRSSLRSWLYRIATNVCLDMLPAAQRRARPMDLEGPSPADSNLGPGLPEHAWVTPVQDSRVLRPDSDPAEYATSRETIRLAFVAALQHLPPRQRATLILREVLCWQASEVAELLDTTVVSVNSALQRARATLGAADLAAPTPDPVDPQQQALIARYVDAFERYDVSELVTLLHADAIMSMPPFALWLNGPQEIAKWFVGHGAGCRGSRLVPTSANGCPAFGSYRVDPEGGHAPWSIQVIETDGERITGLHSFLDTDLFAQFGLPAHLD